MNVPPFQPDVRDLDDVTIMRECLRRFGTRRAEDMEQMIIDAAAKLIAEGMPDDARNG